MMGQTTSCKEQEAEQVRLEAEKRKLADEKAAIEAAKKAEQEANEKAEREEQERIDREIREYEHTG